MKKFKNLYFDIYTTEQYVTITDLLDRSIYVNRNQIDKFDFDNNSVLVLYERGVYTWLPKSHFESSTTYDELIGHLKEMTTINKPQQLGEVPSEFRVSNSGFITTSRDETGKVTTYEPSVGSLSSPPAHYALDPEPINVAKAWNLNFNLGNVLKYIARNDKKGSQLADLKKAMVYLEHEIRSIEDGIDKK
jgi:hypothetical protein